MLVTLDKSWEPIVKTTAYSVVSGEVPFKLETIVICTSSKMSENEYPYIEEIKNFLHKAIHLRPCWGFLKWYG